MNFLFLTLQIVLLLLFSFPVKIIAQNDNSIIVQNNSTDKARLREADRLYQEYTKLREEGKYEQAIELAQKELAIRKEILGVKHVDTIISINDLGFIYEKQRNYQQAESLYQTALNLAQEVLGVKHPHTAIYFKNLGELYKLIGEYQKAEPFFKQSLAIRKEILGEKHPQTLSSMNILGELYNSQGNYQQAEILFQQVLNTRIEVLGENNSYTATSFNNLSQLYQNQGKYEEAIKFIQQSLNIRKELFGEKHSHVAISFHNLGRLYQLQGNYQEAETLYRKALNINRELFDEFNIDTGTYTVSLATLYHEKNEYQQAETLYKQALNIYRKNYGKKHPNIATTLGNLGNLYESQGNYKQAQKLYEDSLAMRYKIYGEKHSSIAFSLNYLGNVSKSQGNFKQAESYYQKALDMRKEVLGEKHFDTAVSIHNLAGLYRLQNEYKQAESLYQEALTIIEELFDKENTLLSSVVNGLAVVYHEQDDYKKALKFYKQSLIIDKKLFGDLNLSKTTLSNLGVLYWEKNDLTVALDYLTQSTDIEEKKLTEFLNNIGDESRKQAYIKTLSRSTYWTMSLHLNTAPNNSRASRLALTNILRRKGRVLDALSNIVATLRQQQNPQIQTLFDNLAEKRSQLASLTYQGVGEQTSKSYQQLITNLEEDIQQLETNLSNQSAEFRTINQPITLDAVQKAIPSNTALIEYMVYKPYNIQTNKWDKPRYAAYILHPDGEPEGIDLGDAETIDKLIEEFRFYIGGEDYEYYETELLESSQQLYQLVFKPLLPLLKNTKTLLISGDSQLNLIPFVALQDEQEKYLLEDYSITYLTSGRDLLKLQTQFESQSESVIIANPTYSLDRSEIAGAKRRGSKRTADLDTLLNCCEPLKHTKVEAEAITPLLSDAQIYTEEKAIVENFANIKAPKILHIATHGFFLPDLEKEEISDDFELNNQIRTIQSENPLLRAGLAFTGFNPANNQMEGALTALDASSLYLWGTKLLVLSACETGLGDVRNGEGVYGLRRAFVLAGVESQLMSLWSVFDKTTQELMVRYYQRLMDGEGRSQSLRQVQLEMLNSEEYQHPVHWAPFIANGDWRSLD